MAVGVLAACGGTATTGPAPAGTTGAAAPSTSTVSRATTPIGTAVAVTGSPAASSATAAPALTASATPSGVRKGAETIQWFQRRSNPPLQNLESGLLAPQWTPSHPQWKVEIVEEQGDNLKATEQLTTLEAGGTPPDLIDDPFAPDNLSRLGLTQPIDDLVARDKYTFPGSSQVFIENDDKVNNKYFNIAHSVGGQSFAMVYNRNMFAQAGVDEPPPDWKQAWSWDQFRIALQKLTKRSGTDVTQVGLYQYGNPIVYIPLPWQADWITADLRTIVCDSPQMQQAYSSYLDLVLKDRTTAASPGVNFGNGDLFVAGKAAINYISAAELPTYAKPTQIEWGFMPSPKGAVASPDLGPLLFGFATGAKQRDGAWELAKWLVDQSRFAKYAGRFSVSKADEAPLLQAQFQGLPNSRWQVVLDAYDIARPGTLIRTHPGWSQMQPVINNAFKGLFSGSAEVPTTLEKLKTALQAIADTPAAKIKA